MRTLLRPSGWTTWSAKGQLTGSDGSLLRFATEAALSNALCVRPGGAAALPT